MRKVPMVGVLAALVVAGVVSLADPGMAGSEPPLPRSCGRQTNFPEACTFVLRSLDALADYQGNIVSAMMRAARVRSGATCDQCIERVTDLAEAVTTNATINDIEAALIAQCERRFSGDRLDACLDAVNAFPEFIGNTWSAIPPTTACQKAGFCPAP